MTHKYLLGMALAVSAGVAHGNLITNGSFEDSSFAVPSWVSLSAGSTVLDGWTVFGNGIDYIGSLWAASDGDHTLDLNMAGAGGGVSQEIATNIGWIYTVEFDLSANMYGAPSPKLMSVEAAGESEAFSFDYQAQEASSGDPKWQHISWTFVATEELSTIAFTGLNASAYGASIDNVSVGGVAPIPAPGAFAIGLGSIGLLGARRRR